jgi:hypothetical protein
MPLLPKPCVRKELAPALAAAPGPRVNTGTLAKLRLDVSAVDVAKVLSPVKFHAAICANPELVIKPTNNGKTKWRVRPRAEVESLFIFCGQVDRSSRTWNNINVRLM